MFVVAHLMRWPSSKTTRLKCSRCQMCFKWGVAHISYVETTTSYSANDCCVIESVWLQWNWSSLSDGAHFLTSLVHEDKTLSGQITRLGPVCFHFSFKWQIREIVWRVFLRVSYGRENKEQWDRANIGWSESNKLGRTARHSPQAHFYIPKQCIWEWHTNNREKMCEKPNADEPPNN